MDDWGIFGELFSPFHVPMLALALLVAGLYFAYRIARWQVNHHPGSVVQPETPGLDKKPYIVTALIGICIPQVPTGAAPAAISMLLTFGLLGIVFFLIVKLNLRWLELAHANSNRLRDKLLLSAVPAFAVWYIVTIASSDQPSFLDGTLPPWEVNLAGPWFAQFRPYHRAPLPSLAFFTVTWLLFTALLWPPSGLWRCVAAGLPIVVLGTFGAALTFYARFDDRFSGITIPLTATPLWLAAIAGTATIIAGIANLRPAAQFRA